MQITIRFWWETGRNTAVFAARQIFIDDLKNKIAGAMLRLSDSLTSRDNGYNCVITAYVQ